MADETVVQDVNHIKQLPDFITGAFDFLPSGFLMDKDDFVKFLNIFLKRLKNIDGMLVDLAENRTLANATGENLDEIGRQLGIYRNGLNDPEYRAVLMILGGNHAKSGTRDDVIETLRQIFGKENFSTYKGENFRFDINIFQTCVKILDILPEIKDMLPLVTHLRLTEADGKPFGFTNGSIFTGFGSVNDTTRESGGGMTSLVYVSDNEDVLG